MKSFLEIFATKEIFDTINGISAPLALVGIIAAVVFQILRQILKAKRISSEPSKSEQVFKYLFILSLVAVIFGFAGFALQNGLIKHHPEKIGFYGLRGDSSTVDTEPPVDTVFVYPESDSIFYVGNTAELLQHLGNKRKLIALPGTYDIYEYLLDTARILYPGKNIDEDARVRDSVMRAVQRLFPHIEVTDPDPLSIESRVVLTELHDVVIEGQKGAVISSSSPVYAAAVLKNCRNITLRNLEMRHSVTKCVSPVLVVEDCRNIRVENCILDGSGTIGVLARNNTDLEFGNNEIRNCRDALANFESCRGRLEFRDNDCIKNGAKFLVNNCDTVVFVDNIITRNGFNKRNYNPLIRINARKLIFSDNVITDNKSDFGIILNAAGEVDSTGIGVNEFGDSAFVWINR